MGCALHGMAIRGITMTMHEDFFMPPSKRKTRETSMEPKTIIYRLGAQKRGEG
jgi:hypothetical protein